MRTAVGSVCTGASSFVTDHNSAGDYTTEAMFAHIYSLSHTHTHIAARFSFKATGLSLRYHLLAASDNTSVTTTQTKT